MVSKARKFVKLKLVEYVGDSSWVVKPIPGYNATTYTVTNKKGDDGLRFFSCDCQGFQSKLIRFNNGELDQEPYCSHTIAVKMHAGTSQHLKLIRGELL
jgi:hypothetical protein